MRGVVVRSVTSRRRRVVTSSATVTMSVMVAPGCNALAGRAARKVQVSGATARALLTQAERVREFCGNLAGRGFWSRLAKRVSFENRGRTIGLNLQFICSVPTCAPRLAPSLRTPQIFWSVAPCGTAHPARDVVSRLRPWTTRPGSQAWHTRCAERLDPMTDKEQPTRQDRIIALEGIVADLTKRVTYLEHMVNALDQQADELVTAVEEGQ